MQQQAHLDTKVMEVVEDAVDDERAIRHHCLGETAAAVALRRHQDAHFDRFGAQRKKLQRLRAELRSPLRGYSRGDIRGELVKQAGGENFQPPRVLARGIRGGRMRWCFAGQHCHLENLV